jgi:hypothetical protein
LPTNWRQILKFGWLNEEEIRKNQKEEYETKTWEEHEIPFSREKGEELQRALAYATEGAINYLFEPNVFHDRVRILGTLQNYKESYITAYQHKMKLYGELVEFYTKLVQDYPVEEY